MVFFGIFFGRQLVGSLTEKHKLKSEASLNGRAKKMEISMETGKRDGKT